MSLLESAIRKAMKRNAVEEILDKEDPQVNTNVIILEEYLKRYKPISSAVGGGNYHIDGRYHVGAG